MKSRWAVKSLRRSVQEISKFKLDPHLQAELKSGVRFWVTMRNFGKNLTQSLLRYKFSFRSTCASKCTTKQAYTKKWMRELELHSYNYYTTCALFRIGRILLSFECRHWIRLISAVTQTCLETSQAAAGLYWSLLPKTTCDTTSFTASVTTIRTTTWVTAAPNQGRVRKSYSSTAMDYAPSSRKLRQFFEGQEHHVICNTRNNTDWQSSDSSNPRISELNKAIQETVKLHKQNPWNPWNYWKQLKGLTHPTVRAGNKAIKFDGTWENIKENPFTSHLESTSLQRIDDVRNAVSTTNHSTAWNQRIEISTPTVKHVGHNNADT